MTFKIPDFAGVEYVVAGLIAVIAYAAVMVAWHVLYGPRRSGPGGQCLWVRDKVQPHAGTVRWNCTTCGEPGYAHGRKAPQTCKRELKGGL